MRNTYLKIAASFIFIVIGSFTSFGKSFSLKPKVSVTVSYQDSTSISALNLTQFMALEATGAIILDTRSPDEFVIGYIPKSIHIGWKGPFKVWVSKILIDKKQLIVIIADQSSRTQVLAALKDLGYMHVLGYLDGGVDDYKKQYLLDVIQEIDATAFAHLSAEGQIIDVRSEKEFAAGHIDNAMNFPLKDLGNFSLNLPQGKNYYIQCQSGYRSMIAISILKANGVDDVINIQGGYQALKKIKEEK